MTVLVIAFGCFLASVVASVVLRYRRDPSGYAIVGGTLHDRRALSIGALVAVAVEALNVIGGEGVVWTLFPAAFFGFVVASIVHHVRNRSAL